MTASRCPYCMDEVRIPPGVPENAVVRCPLCEEEYELSEVGLPPLLQVVRGAEALVGAAAGEAEGTSREAGEFTLQAPASGGPEKESGLPAFSLTDDSGPAGDAAPRPTMRRPSRKKGSALREVIKIVGGGVVGLTIGQLALWYLPGDWKTKQRDPFGLGPHVAKVAPWLVPSQVSGAASPAINNGDQSNTGNANDNNLQDGTNSNVVAQGEMDLNNIGMNRKGNNKKQKKAPNDGGGDLDTDVPPPPTIDPSDGLPEVFNPIAPSDPTPSDPAITDPGSPTIELPTIDDPLDLGIDNPLPTIDDPLTTIPPNNAGDASPNAKPNEELVASINTAQAANQKIVQQWAELDPNQKLAAGKAYYDALVKVSSGLHQLGPDNKVVRNRTDELRELFNTPDDNTAPRNAIYQLGSEQMNAGTPGPVVLYGIIESIGEVKGAPIVRIQLKGGGTALVLCPSPHNGSYAVGKAMFLYGQRLTDDEHQLDDSQVVQASVLAPVN